MSQSQPILPWTISVSFLVTTMESDKTPTHTFSYKSKSESFEQHCIIWIYHIHLYKPSLLKYISLERRIILLFFSVFWFTDEKPNMAHNPTLIEGEHLLPLCTSVAYSFGFCSVSIWVWTWICLMRLTQDPMAAFYRGVMILLSGALHGAHWYPSWNLWCL